MIKLFSEFCAKGKSDFNASFVGTLALSRYNEPSPQYQCFDVLMQQDMEILHEVLGEVVFAFASGGR